MVVYDPPAHELVVYQHPSPPLLSHSSHNGGDPPLTSLPVDLEPTPGQLQPFQWERGHEEMDGFGGQRACRLCHRPFTRWDSYTRDADEFENYFGAEELTQFTSNDYFHLLAATEQAADASREHSARASDDDDSTEPPRRSRRRPRRSSPSGVEIVEEDEKEETKTPDERPYTRSRSSARRSPNARIRLATSSSGEDLTREDVAAAASRKRRGGSAASASVSEAASDVLDPDDDLLDCGLKRSSFNSGYYSKFFREERKIGSGGVGGVYLTHHVLDNVKLGTYAVKKIPVGNSRPWLLQVLKEVRALEGLHHRHIVAYKHSWLESFKPSDFGPEVPCLFLLMEYANRGTLADLIWPKTKSGVRRGSSSSEPPSMTEDQIWEIFLGVLLGLRHLHRAGCIHRDLKPENLLLTSETDALGRDRGLRVLVSDFGNAILKGVPYNRTGNTGTLAFSAPETLIPQQEFAARVRGMPAASPTASGFAGSAAAFSSRGGAAGASVFASPPTAASSPIADSRPLTIAYDEASDLYSCGVILYAMAFAKLPFSSNSPEALFAEIRNSANGVLPLPSQPQRSSEMLRMIRELLSLEPAHRPSLDELLNRPALLQRREAKFAEAQQRFGGVRESQPIASYTERAESYRPPPSALVISPMLSAVLPRRARSVSPQPMSLTAAALPSDSPANATRARRRSVDHTPVTPSDALVLSRISLVEEDVLLSPKLRLLGRAVDTSFHFLVRLMHRVTGYLLFSPTTCWRCQWTITAEALVHLWSFLMKLWLSLSVLLSAPSARSMYGHVFPQVVLTLSLVFTSVLTRPAELFGGAQAANEAKSTKPRILQRLKRMEMWLVASTWRWQLARVSVALTVFLLSAYWLTSTNTSFAWHGLNVSVFVLECLSILCTFFATHPSHTSVHTSGMSPRRAVARARTAAPPTTPITPVDATTPNAARGQHSHAAPVARLPLLLPPVRTPLPSEPDVQLPPSGSRSHRRRPEPEPVRLIEEARRLR
jgi:serine/threonine protein kinase